MNARQLKQLFISFFVKNGHAEIPSASLLPENDPTTLFISAGMHPLVPFLLGQPHPLGKRLTDVQKCVRTGDIDEVGDTFHHTFFEMLGNWSLGEYFKKEMIAFSFEFLTQSLQLPLDRLAVSCFAGDADAPKDEESASYWLAQGIPTDRIAFLPKKNNWWGPASVTGPCGPDSEMFYWTGAAPAPVVFDPNDPLWLEIWNDVFMQYNKNSEGKYDMLQTPNVDTGMGVERTTAVLSGLSDNYLSSIWRPIIQKIEEVSSKKYGSEISVTKSMRIVADHIRTAVFMIADGLEPSNKEAGYVLRRVIRRSVRQGKMIGIDTNFTKQIAKAVLDNQDNYAGVYSELNQNYDKILDVLELEEVKFRKTLDKGLREMEKYIDELGKVTEGKARYIRYADVGQQAFYFYESFGFPFEMFLDEINGKIILDKDEVEKSFNEAKNNHQKQSQTLSAGKFKSGLADHSEVITKYHTATHLLHQALRMTLGEHVQQSGSNITAERLRFDFSHPDKLSPDQLSSVSALVNQQIKAGLDVYSETMPFTEAQESGALAFFGTKYPEIVSVYTIGPLDNFFSKEVCTGPHVKNTSELGIFEIYKEESAGSGKRRIYAVLHQ
jgi:alanyl-tRNA synthetase